MNMHRIYTPVILIFLSFHSIAQKSQELIPRKVFFTGTFEKITEPQPGKTILFDGSMRMTAANRINARETNDILIYNRENSSWDTLASGKTIEDIFLGGFTKAISVSADGNMVYFT